MLRTKQAVMNGAATSRNPDGVAKNLALSQVSVGANKRVACTASSSSERLAFSASVHNASFSFSHLARIFQWRQESLELVNDPHTFISSPVFDSFDRDREVVGVLSANIYWSLLFRNILPPYANGYICILENSFNQTLAYRVDGAEAIYLGEGDLHDDRYDHLELYADINEYVQVSEVIWFKAGKRVARIVSCSTFPLKGSATMPNPSSFPPWPASSRNKRGHRHGPTPWFH